MKNLNKIELLEEMYEMEVHNWICYSKDLSLTEAKKGFSKEWEKSKKKIGLLQEMIDEQKSEEKVNHPKRQINVEVSKEIEEKAKSAFIERLNKRRAKEEPIEKVEEKREYKNNIFDFESYKNDGQIRRK